MLTVQKINGVNAPMFECDVCQKPISDMKDGLLLFDRREQPKTITVHRHDCDRMVRKNFQFYFELPTAMVFLEHNSKFTGAARAEAEQKATLMESLAI